jgi:hypothetical protein
MLSNIVLLAITSLSYIDITKKKSSEIYMKNIYNNIIYDIIFSQLIDKNYKFSSYRKKFLSFVLSLFWRILKFFSL